MSKVAPVPCNEAQRLAALRSYRVLDTAPEPVFDDVTRLVARHFNVAMVLVSLIDEARQWFKSRVGIEITETPRETAFCAHTILGTRPLVVCDAACDPRFRDNPFVVGAPHIRFYAGAPLINADGFRLGTLCLIDDKPWIGFSPTQEEDLIAFAELVMGRLEVRRQRLSPAGGAAAAEPGAELEEAVAHLAHEILTPLSAIVGHAEVIERLTSNDDEPCGSRHSALQIGDMGRYVCELAQRALEAASLGNGHIELQSEWLSLSDVVCDVKKLLPQSAESARVTVEIEATDFPFDLQADRLRLQQMLLNLLGNAMKFTPAGGRIALHARQNADGGLDLTVSDNGPGMTFDEARWALRPFGRVKHCADTKTDGFGLGLPMTQRLIELHDGRLLIDSVRGRGTAITLRFPPHRLRRDDAAVGTVETIRIETPRHIAL